MHAYVIPYVSSTPPTRDEVCPEDGTTQDGLHSSLRPRENKIKKHLLNQEKAPERPRSTCPKWRAISQHRHFLKLDIP